MQFEVLASSAEGKTEDQSEALFHVALTLIRRKDAVSKTGSLIRTANDLVDANEPEDVARLAMTYQRSFGMNSVESPEVARKFLGSSGCVDPRIMQLTAPPCQPDKFIPI